MLKNPLSINVLFAHISDYCFQHFTSQRWMSAWAVCDWGYLFVVMDVLLLQWMGEPPARSFTHTLGLKRSSTLHIPLLLLCSPHTNRPAGVEGAAAAGVCVGLCGCACSAAGWMTRGCTRNSWEAWNQQRECRFYRTHHFSAATMVITTCTCTCTFAYKVDPELDHTDGVVGNIFH